jgi:caffeoyl-CoA O-methyltransferase
MSLYLVWLYILYISIADLIAAGESDTFDFIFIDADKVNYPKYYEKSVQLLRRGGIIAVDNVLWSGYVIDDSKQDEETVAIRAVADRIRDDDRVDSSFLSISDGLQLAVKL